MNFQFFYIFFIFFWYVKVQAYDADEGENAELKYSLRSSEVEGDLPITIDSASGWIHTTRTLDRESHNKFQFQVFI